MKGQELFDYLNEFPEINQVKQCNLEGDFLLFDYNGLQIAKGECNKIETLELQTEMVQDMIDILEASSEDLSDFYDIELLRKLLSE